MQASKYSYRVIWSDKDQRYLGLCSEFPSNSWSASTQEGALKGIVETIEGILNEKKEKGEKIPEPISLNTFSGRILLRTTPEIHRRLMTHANEAGVSLNRYINSLLLGSEMDTTV